MNTKFLNIVLLGCGNINPESNVAVDETLESKPEIEWDRHQFFSDLFQIDLENLGQTIAMSDRVVAYNWNGNEGNPAAVQSYIVDAYGNFDDRVGRKITLDPTQKARLKELLTDSTNFEGVNAMCFIPHIAFVYYRQSQIIGQSNVCFLCSGVKSVPNSTTALSESGSAKLKEFAATIGLKIYDDEAQLTH